MGQWTWRNRLLGDWPMKAADHDPVNTLTKNRGRAGSTLDAVWTAGVTAPTKLGYRRGYYFDGGDRIDCVDCADLQLGHTGSVLITFSMSSFTSYIVLCGNGNFAVARYGYVIWIQNTTRQLRAMIGTGAAANTVLSTAYPDLGVIHTAALVWDGAFVHIYHLGISGGSTAQTIDPTYNGYPYRIGGHPLGGYPLTGNIYHVGMADFALSPSQVSQYHREQMQQLHQL